MAPGRRSQPSLVRHSRGQGDSSCPAAITAHGLRGPQWDFPCSSMDTRGQARLIQARWEQLGAIAGRSVFAPRGECPAVPVAQSCPRRGLQKELISVPKIGAGCHTARLSFGPSGSSGQRCWFCSRLGFQQHFLTPGFISECSVFPPASRWDTRWRWGPG